MIVVDASAVLELLLGTERAERVAARVLAPDERLDAPHLLDIEIGQALRRLAQLNAITVLRAEEALADFASLVIERHAHRELLPRIWQLRDSLTAYDAAYVTLAEALDAPVLTCDAKLGRAHGHRARIEVVS
ncbi:MAG TPA: type II toxin-antitoxin system VapC family toxin [Gammaproteobacteria bacterium]|nr:type II toxin-antitoxin system VapC family toxin [Gammaproteobacteria bacterium]